MSEHNTSKENKPKSATIKDDVIPIDKDNNIKTNSSITTKDDTSLEKLDTNDNILIPQKFSDRQQFFQMLADAANASINTPGDVAIVWMRAKELGIGLGTALTSMNIIKNKVSLDIHTIRAKLSDPKYNIWWERTENCIPIYKYVDARGMNFTWDTLPPNVNIVPFQEIRSVAPQGMVNVSLLPDAKTNGKTYVLDDYRTTYTFERTIEYPKLGEKVRNITSSWTLRQAQTAKLLTDDPEKSGSWEKYRGIMLDKFAFMIGARLIAADILYSTYDPAELDNSLISNEL